MTQQKRKKQDLFDAFVGALGDIIVVLRPYVLGGRVPKEPVTEARSRKEGGFVHYHYHRRSYADLCGRLADEWHHLPTVLAAIECLTLDKDVQKEFQLVGFGDLANYVKTQIFSQFIYVVFRRTRRWPPTKSTVEKLFIEFEDYLLGDTVSYQVLVPLENFECESKSLSLEPGIVVRELCEGEKEGLLTRVLSGWSLQNVMEVSGFKFAATIEVLWKKGTTQLHHKSSVEKLLTGLRLFKAGGIGANSAYKREIRWQPGHIVGGVERHAFTLRVVGPTYRLNVSEASELQAFWRWLYGQPFSASTAVAVRWFNHGYQDWIAADRIVSFVTAFESLFLLPKDEKGKRLRSRIPRLLADAAGRSHVQKNVADLWNLRSNIIHARPYSETLAEGLVTTAEDYVRESIRRFMELERTVTPSSHHDILKWIDNADVDIAKQRLFPQWISL